MERPPNDPADPPGDESGFEPIRPNPYIVGNPIRDRAMFFGREAEFDLVRRRFHDSEGGSLLVFCGERRSGKTSILFQILDQRLGPDFIPVLIDMQSMAITTEADFLEKIVDEILDALGPGGDGIRRPAATSGASRYAAFQKFIEAVLRANPGKRLILLFDEYELFESKIDAGILAQDVLYTLATLMENNPVYLVFTGSRHLEQRRREYWKILGKAATYKEISYLDPEDAFKLIRRPVEGRVRYAERATEDIFRLTAGQPFYTQAVCQNLVDHLNEHHTNFASREIVRDVAAAMVENPLPQMIFLWDSLEHDEKLVMALLAEALPEESSEAAQRDLSRLISQRQYPLSLSHARIATALEKLFKNQLLLKNDAAQPPSYAFRMDLWRLWIRRMHSVWQVMREEGLDIRTVPRRRRMRVALVAGAVGVVGIAAAFLALRPKTGPPPPIASRTTAGTGRIFLAVEPSEALIFKTDVSLEQAVTTGALLDAVAAGREHPYRFSAPGYVDTALALSVAAGESESLQVRLRPHRGTLRVESDPAGAEIQLHGRPVGRSPVVLTSLEVPLHHRITASMPGRSPVDTICSVLPDTAITIRLTLAVPSETILVTTEPAGAAVLVDGVRQSQLEIFLRHGSHVFSARLDGFTDLDSTLQVDAGIRRIHLRLRPEPPGVLVVLGDLPGRIFVDDELVKPDSQNSGPRTLRPGWHRIRVEPKELPAIVDSVEVRSSERVTYDYSHRTVRRNPLGGS